MIFLKYKEPQAEHVQFQRLAFGLLALTFVLSDDLLFIKIFILLNVVSFITTVNYSPTTLLFKFLSLLLGKSLFVTPPQYASSYRNTKLASIFEDLMRIGGGVAIFYLYQYSPLAALMFASFMAIALLISSFFGFCLSSLPFMGYRTLKKKFETKT